ncbi:MAG: sialidase family protein [Chloroflexia bacterium]
MKDKDDTVDTVDTARGGFESEIQTGGRNSTGTDRNTDRSDSRVGPPLLQRASRRSPGAWVVAGALLAAAVAGLWFWAGGQGPQYVSTPGQGHVHTAIGLPVPNSTSPALWLGTHDGLYLKELTPDGPKGWRKMNAPLSSTDVMAVSSALRPGSPIYAAGHDLGVQRSDDGGAKWRQVMPGAPMRDVHALAVDPNDPDRLYIWAEVAGLFTSSNGGATWETPGGGKGLSGPMKLTALAVSSGKGTESATLYAGTNLGLFVSRDEGQNWTPSPGEAGEQPVYSLLVLGGSQGSQGQAPEIYVGTATGVLHSSDGGSRWKRLQNAASLGGIGGFAIDSSTTSQGRLLAVNAAAEVFTSDDQGQSWRHLP